MNRAKAKARPKRASRKSQAAAVRVSELKAFLDQQNRAWQKIEALMVALEFAANHEAEFDVSDGLAGVITLIGQSLTALDTLEVRHGN